MGTLSSFEILLRGLKSVPYHLYRQRLTLPQRDAAVPSACPGLTFVFGMGTGVSLGLLPPDVLPLFTAQCTC